MGEEIRLIDFWRVCPSCGKAWASRHQWENETIHVSRETRKVEHDEKWTIRRKRAGVYTAEIRVELRKHMDCGGTMISQGVVTDETLPGYSPNGRVVRQ
jgi:hypothetical protein